jgi:6,7-dimethyl-8-ribityllumazine synthase
MKSHIEIPAGKNNLKKSEHIAVVQSVYHSQITDTLLKSVQQELARAKVKPDQIKIYKAPGAFELPAVALRAAKNKNCRAVITLGCIVKGETPHFDFVASASAHGIMEVGLTSQKPVVFGLLTVNNFRQAQDRIAGGKRGDKGLECARAALHLIAL